MAAKTNDDAAGKPRVLVVDDDEGVRSLIAEILKGVFVCVPARGLREAEAVLKRREPIDAALIDARLPDGNGLELIPYARRQSPQLDILVTSGVDTLADLEPWPNISVEFVPKRHLHEGASAWGSRLAIRRTVKDPDLAAYLIQRAHELGLTPKESQVIALKALDLRCEEIEDRAAIAEGTRKFHGRSILRKARQRGYHAKKLRELVSVLLAGYKGGGGMRFSTRKSTRETTPCDALVG